MKIKIKETTILTSLIASKQEKTEEKQKVPSSLHQSRLTNR